jgi:pentapeptide MXKDX repeat protein
MIARILSLALAGTLVLGTATIPTVAFAEALKKEETKKDETKKKESGAPDNRMKACGAEWQTMKKDGRAKGTTYAEFSKECLKKKS